MLEEHIAEHRELPESARVRDLGAEKALIQDYSGRVVFELLQNALDRADSSVLIDWNESTGTLEVANDGRGITSESIDGKLSDLKSLLSLHSSSKSARESVGNKGIGFRSVFGATKEVEVCSRTQDNAWWGMKLQHPTLMEPPGNQWGRPDAASFYQPKFYSPEEGRFDDFVTVIRLLNVKIPEAVSSISNSVRELKDGPLTFLDRRVKNKALKITLRDQMGEVTHTMDSANLLGITERSLLVPDEVYSNTGLDLKNADVRVIVEYSPLTSRYWSYLPTEQMAGFGVQIHADFYLSNSRRNIALRPLEQNAPGNDPAGWNSQLVNLAADCVIELWKTPAVCKAEQFWKFATPRACDCPHLRKAVAIRFWRNNAADFGHMVSLSFPTDKTFTLKRYRQLFDAMEAWADYAYRELTLGKLSDLRLTLLEHLQKSEANVLPVISGDPALDDVSVDCVKPLIVGEKGKSRGKNVDRIYWRPYSQDATIKLPDAVLKQRTFVTTFHPELPGLSPAQQGLLEFSRPEILAQLQPGIDDDEHEAILVAAIELAIDEPKGGMGSILTRAKEFGVGAAWRFKILETKKAQDTMGQVSQSLAALKVKTMTGTWETVNSCGRTCGPWPQLNEDWLSNLIAKNQLKANLESSCLLLGVFLIPLYETGDPELPANLSIETMRDLLKFWEHMEGFLRPGHDSSTALRNALENCCWLYPSEELNILDGVGSTAPYAPNEVWLQLPKGFKTKLLPRLEQDPTMNSQTWYRQLGICSPVDESTEKRLRLAFKCLQTIEPQKSFVAGEQRDLIELYCRLIDSTFRHEIYSSIPLLYQTLGKNGSIESLAWGGAEDGILHDSGDHTAALRVFPGIRVWVVRKASKVEKLGVKNFEPTLTRHASQEYSDNELSSELENKLYEAMPDLIAAARAATFEFDADKAIETFVSLDIRHYEDIWTLYTLPCGRSVELGRGTGGDVFEETRSDRGKELRFDGNVIQTSLVECALPLSILFANNKAFVSLFKEGLYAWSLPNDSISHAVQRFRRDNGLSEQEIRSWKERLEEKKLHPEQLSQWENDVQTCLRQFCNLKRAPKPGMVITPLCFDQRAHHSEDKISAALAEIKILPPQVDFARFNKQLLRELDCFPYLAAAAEQHVGKWTEQLYEQLKKQVELSLEGEEQRLRYLDFSAEEEMKLRFGIKDLNKAVSEEAKAFARGEIPLKKLPEEPTLLRLQKFSGSTMQSIDSQSSDDFIRDAQRKATGGLRAEEAIVKLALSNALNWHQSDPDGFDKAVDLLLRPDCLGSQGQEKRKLLGTPSGMRNFLHVAQYIGNVGFDVLVPTSHSGKFAFRLVEVKRVTHLESAVFYLSENERRRAIFYGKSGYDWQLWLVSSSGESEDVTSSVLKPFEDHESEIETLAKNGLRPGEWFFKLTRPLSVTQ